jgi:hypothetical protein
MTQLRSFAPWIVYPIAASVFGWRVGSTLALTLCIFGLVRARRSGGADSFVVGAGLFFAALVAIAFSDPTSSVHRFVPALVPAALAVAAAVSILIGQPFTVAFAKRVAPQEFWGTPLFDHINVVLTSVWAASFAVTAALIAMALATEPHAVGVLIGVQVVGFVVPMRISRTYPAAARGRYTAAT